MANRTFYSSPVATNLTMADLLREEKMITQRSILPSLSTLNAFDNSSHSETASENEENDETALLEMDAEGLDRINEFLHANRDSFPNIQVEQVESVKPAALLESCGYFLELDAIENASITFSILI